MNEAEGRHDAHIYTFIDDLEKKRKGKDEDKEVICKMYWFAFFDKWIGSSIIGWSLKPSSSRFLYMVICGSFVPA